MILDLNLKDNKRELQVLADALNSKRRLNILTSIQKGNEIGHKELAESIGVSQVSISYHIQKLVESGIIVERKGTGKRNTVTKIPNLKIDKIVINLK